MMAKRHAITPEELEEILLDGILTGEPVKEEITADAPRPCVKHPELIDIKGEQWTPVTQ
jgi:hypothetical protein